MVGIMQRRHCRRDEGCEICRHGHLAPRTYIHAAGVAHRNISESGQNGSSDYSQQLTAQLGGSPMPHGTEKHVHVNSDMLECRRLAKHVCALKMTEAQ